MLFGIDRSAVNIGDRSQNFKDRDLYAYPANPEGAYLITSQPMKVTPDRIDYVVYHFAHSRPLKDQWLSEVDTYGMEKPSLLTDIVVVEIADGASAKAFDDNVLLRLLKMNRSGTGIPYFPMLGQGLQKFGHQYVGGNQRSAQKNEVEALDFLCGPASRDGAETCRRSLFR